MSKKKSGPTIVVANFLIDWHDHAGRHLGSDRHEHRHESSVGGQHVGVHPRHWKAVDSKGREFLARDHGDGHFDVLEGGRSVLSGLATADGFRATSTTLSTKDRDAVLDLIHEAEIQQFGRHRRVTKEATGSKTTDPKRSASETNTVPRKTAAKKTAARKAPEKTAAKKPRKAAKKSAPKKAQKKAAAKPVDKHAAREVALEAHGHAFHVHIPEATSDARVQGILNRATPGRTKLSTVTNQLAKVGAFFVPHEGQSGDGGVYDKAARPKAAKSTPKSAKKTTPKRAKRAAATKTPSAKPASSSIPKPTKPVVPPSGPRASQRGAEESPRTVPSARLPNDATLLRKIKEAMTKEGVEHNYPIAEKAFQRWGDEIREAVATHPEGPVKGFSEWAKQNEPRLLELIEESEAAVA
jgi:hypothetical protein